MHFKNLWDWIRSKTKRPVKIVRKNSLSVVHNNLHLGSFTLSNHIPINFNYYRDTVVHHKQLTTRKRESKAGKRKGEGRSRKKEGKWRR